MSYFTRVRKGAMLPNRHDPAKVNSFFSAPGSAGLFPDPKMQKVAEEMIARVIENNPGATTPEKADMIFQLFVTHPELCGHARLGLDKKPSWHHAHVAQALQQGEHAPDAAGAMMGAAIGMDAQQAVQQPQQPAQAALSGVGRPEGSPEDRKAPKKTPQGL